MIVPQVDLPEGTQGPWTIKHRVIEDDIGRMRLAFDGRSPGNPGDKFTILHHAQRGIIMSDTQAERRDHYAFVSMAKRNGGHVLINGLGLGMCLKGALASEAVTQATVIELDTDVIALTGPHYLKDPRVEIVNASAFDYEPPKDIRYGAVWHDIWDTICEDNRPQMIKLHRKYGRRADWQGSWGRDFMDAERARDRRAWYR